MQTRTDNFHPLPPALYVAFAMALYGFSEALATYRIATEMGPAVALRIVGTASLLGLMTWAAGLASSRLAETRVRPMRLAVLALAVAMAAGCTPQHTSLLLVLTVGIAGTVWAMVGPRPAPAGAFGLCPLWLGSLFAALREFPLASAGPVFGLVATAVGALVLLLHVRLHALSERTRHVTCALLGGGGAFVACLAPWPLATHYGEVKLFFVLTIVAIVGSALGIAAKSPRRGWRAPGHVMLLVGAAQLIALTGLDRATAFGPFPIDSLVGRVASVAFETPTAASPAEFGGAACPATPAPTGVIWVMIDTLRADHFTPQSSPILDRWAAQSTTFANAYSPGAATYTAFATWIPERPDKVGVPFRAATTVRGAKLIKTVLGDDVPTDVLGETCSGEGAAFVDGLEAGGLNLLYLPVAHAPYHCTDESQSEQECYAEAVRCVTAELEAVFDWAEDHTGWAVVVTSDHGESFGEKGVHYHGASLWEEQIRVPLSVRAPGFEAGHTVDTPVSNGWLSGSLGCWLGDDPRLFGGATTVLSDEPIHRPLAVHSFAADYGHHGAKRESAVIDWPHKLTVDLDTGYERLIDLENDGAEAQNLAAERPEVARALRVELARLPGPPRRR